MTTDTITFTDKSDLRKGLYLLWQGIVTMYKATIHILNKSAHRWPYAWIFIAILIAAIISIVNIGKARAERDALNKENYELRQKLASVMNELEISGRAQYE